MSYGRLPVQTISVNTAANNINNNAYLVLDTALNNDVKFVQICNGTTSVLKLASGAAGSETDILHVPASSVYYIPLDISKDVPISVRAVSANASSGFFLVNLFR